MKRYPFYLGCLILASFVIGCKQEKTTPCGAAQGITVNSECYAGNGLKFTASNYGDAPLSFEWSIIALKDPAVNLGWTVKDEKIRMIASNTFVVPDSLATNYQRLIIRAASNCGGQLKYSMYYGFLKLTNSGCVTWTSQNL